MDKFSSFRLCDNKEAWSQFIKDNHALVITSNLYCIHTHCGVLQVATNAWLALSCCAGLFMDLNATSWYLMTSGVLIITFRILVLSKNMRNTYTRYNALPEWPAYRAYLVNKILYGKVSAANMPVATYQRLRQYYLCAANTEGIIYRLCDRILWKACTPYLIAVIFFLGWELAMYLLDEPIRQYCANTGTSLAAVHRFMSVIHLLIYLVVFIFANLGTWCDVDMYAMDSQELTSKYLLLNLEEEYRILEEYERSL